jgi:hypothetical protein
MQEMYNSEPKVFNQIDGVGSHSYPNPGFEQPPWINTRKSIWSFVYEKRLADLLSGKNLPVFITETGWSSNTTAKPLIGRYFVEAFASVWSNENVVAVTPFLLNAGAGPFVQFSLINKDGDKNEIHDAISDIQKINGGPVLSHPKNIHGQNSNKVILPTKDFSNFKKYDNATVTDKVNTAVELVKWILRV